MIKDQGPERGSWDPPATLAHLQISPIRKAAQLAASPRNTPKPQVCGHQAGNGRACGRERLAVGERGFAVHHFPSWLCSVFHVECVTESV